MSPPQSIGRPGLERPGQVFFGLGDRFTQGIALSQMGGNGRGESTAGAKRIVGLDPFGLEHQQGILCFEIQDIRAALILKMPPFSRTASGPKSLKARQASCIWVILSIGSSNKTAASGRLGVMTVAIGIRVDFSAATASSSSSLSPLLATMTGSTTIQRGCQWRSRSATVRMAR